MLVFINEQGFDTRKPVRRWDYQHVCWGKVLMPRTFWMKKREVTAAIFSKALYHVHINERITGRSNIAYTMQ